MVADLSASGSAPSTGSMAPAPTSFRRAMAFCRAGLAGSVEDRISVTSRSARRFVKKLIRPFRRGSFLHAPVTPPNVQEFTGRTGAGLSGAHLAAVADRWSSKRTASGRLRLCHSRQYGPLWVPPARVRGLRAQYHYNRNPSPQALRPLKDMISASSVTAVRAALEAYSDPYPGVTRADATP